MRGRRIGIVGFAGRNREWVKEWDQDVEVWSLNEAHSCQRVARRYTDDHKWYKDELCPCRNPAECVCAGFDGGHEHDFIQRFDRFFQIHPANWREQEREEKHKKKLVDSYKQAFGRNDHHIAFLARSNVPVYMNFPDTRIPTALHYPLAEVAERFGREFGQRKQAYLTSTPAYMIALALLEHERYRWWNPRTWRFKVNELLLAGIELAIGTEYFWQRPCFEYYCGIARGMGIKVSIPPPKYGTSILSAPVYGLDDSLPGPKDYKNPPMNLVYKHNGKEDEVAVRETEVLT